MGFSQKIQFSSSPYYLLDLINDPVFQIFFTKHLSVSVYSLTTDTLV